MLKIANYPKSKRREVNQKQKNRNAEKFFKNTVS